ncbi:MAG TPA: FkbM family methyltransferase [Candidatus Binataceae bacterium]|nr:FkbM family methyltransferase [Candidatus Binataceae bacterium]
MQPGDAGDLDPKNFQSRRVKLLSAVTRRLIMWRGGLRISKLLIKLFGNSDPVEVEVLGFKMVLDPRDRMCLPLIYYPPLFEAGESAAFFPQIRPGDVVLDAGAHFGFYSLMAERCGAKVLSIEADPRTFRFLKYNLAANRSTNVCAVQVGISDRHETLQLFGNLELGDRSAHTFVPGSGRHDAIEVQCLPLAEILAANGFDRCDLLKMDVEGFEYRVLKPFLEQTKIRPRLILVEYYEHRNTGDVRALLQEHGYRLERQIWANYVFTLAGKENP